MDDISNFIDSIRYFFDLPLLAIKSIKSPNLPTDHNLTSYTSTKDKNEKEGGDSIVAVEIIEAWLLVAVWFLLQLH